jgi:hypothetical protein
MSTQDTNHDQTTDPTPRTAATARDALAVAILAVFPAYAYRGDKAEHDADAILAALPDGWTLAAAEAPGRVAALEAALDELMTLRTEHGLNCYVTDEVGCVCGLDQALERITDVRLAAAAPTPSDVER